MKKRIIALILSMTMACSLLAGCGNSTKEPQGSLEGQQEESTGDDGGENGQSVGGELLPEDNKEEHITFSIWTSADDYKHYNTYDENPVVQVLNDMFDVTMEFQLPAIGTEVDNFNLMMGTGDYTDVINATYSIESQSALYEEGVIIDIAPYLERYMPNYYALLQSDEELKKLVYDDDGRAYGIYRIEDLTRNQWGGLVYRRDILEAMTGGNIAFPSGKEDPVTVEDWDYMLPFMKSYFEYSGIAETACVVLPACGYTITGELNGGFGTSGSWQLSADGNTVEYGPSTQEFYNYVSKMKEWYGEGYIYQDFASRINDLFFLPNTSLTYGGAAGAWFGLLGQLGSAMSLPEYDLHMDVRPIPSPLDTEHNISETEASFYIFNGIASYPFCITTNCEEEKLARVLTIFDYFFTEEGYTLTGLGLNAEQAENSELYQSMGMSQGAYWYDEDGNFYQHEIFINGGDGIEPMSFTGQRLPGIDPADKWPANKERSENDDIQDVAGQVWTSYGRNRQIPPGAIMNAEESKAFNSVYTNLIDYVNSMIPQFIMGTEELNEETWKAYTDQLNSLGLETANQAHQSALDRYNAR